jgi:hypothetical protein
MEMLTRLRNYRTWPFLLFFFLLLFSCDILFREPQPSWVRRNEKAFPPLMRGTFVCGSGLVHDMYHDKGDTIRIDEKRIRINDDFDYTLSESVILREYRGAYFLNIFEKEDHGWIVFRALPKSGEIIFSMMMTNDDDPGYLTRLREITDVETVNESGEGDIRHYIRPRKSQFRKILATNLFNSGDTLVRIK